MRRIWFVSDVTYFETLKYALSQDLTHVDIICSIIRTQQNKLPIQATIPRQSENYISIDSC